MKTASILTSLSIAVILPISTHAETVYDNSVNDPEIRFLTGTAEVGDEINLGGSQRLLDTYSFEFFYTNSSSSYSQSPSIKVTLYENDGPDFNSEPTPGTVLWSSPTYTGLIGSYTARSTLNFTQGDFGSSILLTDTFTWTVQFGNLVSADEIGLDIYDPPVTGSSAPDYWIDSGSGWELKVHPTDPLGNPFNFAAVFTAVPEPSSIALVLLGGLALAGRRFRS